ncbi:MAG: sugar ABC transporter substrate-binding protein [Alphaproteobacteria bacterium]|nr:sugar ABC transporter substrate-binding protein [Alphaproteobacteria bacterium]
MKTTTFAIAFGLAASLLAGTALAQDKSLNMIVIEGGDTTALQAVVDAYKADHPGVTINLQPYPFAQFFQVAELRLRSADAGIDLVYVDAPLLASYASRGFLSPIDPAIATTALVPAAVDAGKYEGTQYALPINNSAQVLFFNKAQFEAAGITPPAGLTKGETATQDQVNTLASTERWTWEQVADAARKLTTTEGGRTTNYGFTVEQFGELYQLQPFGESLGSPVIGADGYTAKGYLDSEAWTKAATFWSDLYNSWAVSPKSLGYGEAASLFGNGQLAMFAGGTWNLPGLEASGVDFGVAPYPYFEGGSVVTPTGSWYVGVNAASANQAEAMDFASYLTTSDAGTKAWFDSLQQLPTYVPLLDTISTSPDYDAFPSNVFRLGVYDSLNTAKARPVTAAYGQLQDAFRTAFVDIANGVPVADALASAVQKFEAAAARVAQ